MARCRLVGRTTGKAQLGWSNHVLPTPDLMDGLPARSRLSFQLRERRWINRLGWINRVQDRNSR
jgi:hypothetical protein